MAFHLEKLQRDFIWVDLNDVFKFHLVNWNRIGAPIQAGGLGICNLHNFNKSLLGK